MMIEAIITRIGNRKELPAPDDVVALSVKKQIIPAMHPAPTAMRVRVMRFVYSAASSTGIGAGVFSSGIIGTGSSVIGAPVVLFF
jgi:hypothetical protein